MMENLTNKNKLIILGVAILIMVILMYHLAIKKTLYLWKENNILSEKIEMLENAPNMIKNIEMELGGIKNLIYTGDSNPDNFRVELLKIIAKNSAMHKVTFKELPEYYSNNQNEYWIHANKITLEGDFKHLISFIHSLEEDDHAGNLVSSCFYIIKDIRTKKESLMADIYIQTINSAK